MADMFSSPGEQDNQWLNQLFHSQLARNSPLINLHRRRRLHWLTNCSSTTVVCFRSTLGYCFLFVVFNGVFLYNAAGAQMILPTFVQMVKMNNSLARWSRQNFQRVGGSHLFKNKTLNDKFIHSCTLYLSCLCIFVWQRWNTQVQKCTSCCFLTRLPQNGCSFLANFKSALRVDFAYSDIQQCFASVLSCFMVLCCDFRQMTLFFFFKTWSQDNKASDLLRESCGDWLKLQHHSEFAGIDWICISGSDLSFGDTSASLTVSGADWCFSLQHHLASLCIS